VKSGCFKIQRVRVTIQEKVVEGKKCPENRLGRCHTARLNELVTRLSDTVIMGGNPNLCSGGGEKNRRKGIYSLEKRRGAHRWSSKKRIVGASWGRDRRLDEEKRSQGRFDSEAGRNCRKHSPLKKASSGLKMIYTGGRQQTLGD